MYSIMFFSVVSLVLRQSYICFIASVVTWMIWVNATIIKQRQSTNRVYNSRGVLLSKVVLWLRDRIPIMGWQVTAHTKWHHHTPQCGINIFVATNNFYNSAIRRLTRKPTDISKTPVMACMLPNINRMWQPLSHWLLGIMVAKKKQWLLGDYLKNALLLG